MGSAAAVSSGEIGAAAAPAAGGGGGGGSGDVWVLGPRAFTVLCLVPRSTRLAWFRAERPSAGLALVVFDGFVSFVAFACAFGEDRFLDEPDADGSFGGRRRFGGGGAGSARAG
jgi:hypothetical protein